MSDRKGRDRRLQKRFTVKAKLDVILPESGKVITAHSNDLSWGGALFTVPRMLPQAGEISIRLPWAHQRHIVAKAEILRVTPTADAHRVAIRFTSMTHKHHARLERLLELLNNRRPEQICEELKIVVDDAAEFRKTAEKIAEGIYVVQTFAAYQPQQSLLIVIEGPDHLPIRELRLRALVIRTDRLATSYRLTVAFEHPLTSMNDLVARLLKPVSRAK